MKLWSKGLGQRTLTIDFRPAKIGREGRDLILNGTIRIPVVWEYKINFQPFDAYGVIHLILSWKTISWFISSFIRGIGGRYRSYDEMVIEHEKEAEGEED